MAKGLSDFFKTNKGLLFVLFFSAALKSAIAVTAGAIKPDGLRYICAAQQFASGHFNEGMALYPLPAYSILIALVHYIIPNWIAAARFITVTASVFTLIPLYLLTRNVFDGKIAFWACLAFALAPFPNEISALIIRDPVFLLLFAWGVYFANLAVSSPRFIYFVSAAFFSWSSVLFRIEGILLVAFFTIFLIYQTFRVESRWPYVRGVLLWVFFPFVLFLAGSAILGPEFVFMNRFGEVAGKIRNFINLGFMSGYYELSCQLKELEKASVYPGLTLNFAETARHFIPLIYLMGLVYTFFKVHLHVLFLPLFFGFKYSAPKNQPFLLLLTISYFLMIYFRLFEMGFIQIRYLYAASFLFYPWIGAGISRLLSYVEKSSRVGLLSSALVVVMFVLPALRSSQYLFKSDSVLGETGKWLRGNPGFADAEIITNDPRFLFYADREIDYLHHFKASITINRANREKDFTAMEKLALKAQADFIVIRVSSRKRDLIPEFTSYRMIKEIRGDKDIAIIYNFYNPQRP